MLVAFSFRARPGKAAELERLLNDPDAALAVARAMGATRNVLFWQGDRMVRVLEFPDGVKPVPLAEVAKRDPGVARFLAEVGRLSDPPFDPAMPGSLDAFNQAAALRLLYDVRPDGSGRTTQQPS